MQLVCENEDYVEIFSINGSSQIIAEEAICDAFKKILQGESD